MAAIPWRARTRKLRSVPFSVVTQRASIPFAVVRSRATLASRRKYPDGCARSSRVASADSPSGQVSTAPRSAFAARPPRPQK